ncbi:HbrB-like-domain-containing protein [Cercophora newfieldiana]|uniref:HbrB-like-domain-containing protein n=1 Tax=Cercophora newfieldiana TaxID=92897 RepID=A0AA39XS56_9PEZI|nr:HbrB-like-domain-containing protein [Cercophora newfieldiana]
MQPTRPTPRAPGSFSPLPTLGGSDMSRNLNLTIPKARAASTHTPEGQAPSPATPIYASFTSHSNGSSSSLHNFSRPNLSTAVSAARSVAGTHSPSDARNASPLSRPAISPSSSTFRGHSRKHSQNAGMFEPTLPSTSTSNLSQVGMAHSSPKLAPAQPQRREMSASQIAAQAAVMQHQSQQQQVHQQQQIQQAQLQLQHARQRSQTVPAPGAEYEQPPLTNKRTSGGAGPLSPPVLSLTEASAPRESGFGNQGYHNGLVGNHTLAATAAANIVFPRSGQSSPGLTSQSSVSSSSSMPPPALPPPVPEKPAKSEKSKVKLFSRPAMKIGVKGDTKEKPLPSPAKIGHPFGNLQRGNFSTTSLDSSSQSFYSLQNSSTATIRPVDTSAVEKEVKEKEKKHHFLSRQKHKLKEDYHLPLSSASSNSRPSDPSAPSSLYNFNLPPSPGPNSTSFKSMSGLDLRHGGRALREKKKEERLFDDAASTIVGSEWPGPSSVSSASGPLASSVYHEPFDSGKFGLNNMMLDDAWPYLKAKLLVVFEAEDLRVPVEDLNRVVSMHIQYCINRRSPNIIVDDLRELLATGFSSLDQTLRKTSEDRLIPSLVELWMFTFTGILPYLQAVFLPLDLEFSGSGSLMTTEQARDFWGGIPSTHSPVETPTSLSSGHGHGQGVNVSPASSVLEVRRLVLLSFRDIVILPRYETLKAMFSRLSLEFLPQALASMALTSPVTVPSPMFGSQGQGQFQQLYSTSPAESSQGSFSLNNVNSAPGGYPRPNTAMSLDPSVSSFHSAGSTLLGDGPGSGNRSRAISNVSYGSDNTRPYTPNSLYALGASVPSFTGNNPPGGANPTATSSGSLREQNVEGSKQVTEMVGRMLQCMSVLASVGHVPGAPPSGISAGGSNAAAAAAGDEGNQKIEELNKLLKLNWLGRGRTGRNRRGIVGGRVKRGAILPPPLMAGLSNTSSSTGGVALGGGSSSASVREEK